jgi:AsmA protein
MKALKWALVGAGVLVLIGAAVIAFFAATFDPNAYKPRIVELVKQQTGRTLTMDGTIGLTFFPKLGAAVDKVTLSEPNGSRPFARVEEARVAVALLPLLRKQLVVDRVTLKGLAADLVRDKDGRTNFDDLTGQSAKAGKPGEAPAPRPGGAPLVIDIGGIVIEDATLGWRDERDGTRVRLSEVNLETGRLASGVPGKLTLSARVAGEQPKANLKISADTGYRLDFDTQAVVLSALDVKATGDAPGADGLDARIKAEAVEVDTKTSRVSVSRVELAARTKDGLDATVAVPRLQLTGEQAESQAITGVLKLVSAERAVEAKLQLAPITAKGKQLALARLDLDLTAKQGDLTAQGKLATPVTLDLDRQRAVLPGIAGDLAISGKALPGGVLKAAVKGAAQADWGAQSAGAALAVKLDESNIDANVDVAHWSRPAVNFTIVADRLNVDRYLPPSKPEASGPAGRPTGGSPGTAAEGAAEQPLDLSPLKAVNATGSLKIGALQVSNVKAQSVALAIKAADGKLDVNPLSATLYEGTLTGTLGVNANSNSFVVKQKLAGVSVGPLLRDAAAKDLLEGRGTVVLDLTTAGTMVTALKRSLAGTTNVALRDGSIKGIDIAGTIRTARAALGSKRALEQQAQGGAKTDFSELTASFAIKNGVAHNEDLQAKSPLLRLSGRGDIDIGASTMDYTVKASAVATSTGQGGKELARVAGVTVPVRATGPLDNLHYTVDVAELATDLAESALERELQRRLKGKSGKDSGATDAVGDVLRGLLGKPK